MAPVEVIHTCILQNSSLWTVAFFIVVHLSTTSQMMSWYSPSRCLCFCFGHCYVGSLLNHRAVFPNILQRGGVFGGIFWCSFFLPKLSCASRVVYKSCTKIWRNQTYETQQHLFFLNKKEEKETCFLNVLELLNLFHLG